MNVALILRWAMEVMSLVCIPLVLLQFHWHPNLRIGKGQIGLFQVLVFTSSKMWWSTMRCPICLLIFTSFILKWMPSNWVLLGKPPPWKCGVFETNSAKKHPTSTYLLPCTRWRLNTLLQWLPTWQTNWVEVMRKWTHIWWPVISRGLKLCSDVGEKICVMSSDAQFEPDMPKVKLAWPKSVRIWVEGNR